jgi:hypothetical protein
MTKFIALYILFWVFTLRNFSYAFVQIGTDAISGKKLRVTQNPWRLFAFGCIFVALGHVLTCVLAAAAGFLWTGAENILTPIVLVPIFTALPHVILYRMGRKHTAGLSEKPLALKGLLIGNTVLIWLFDAAYACMISWYSSRTPIGILGPPDQAEVDQVNRTTLLGTIVILAVFLVLKILLQLILVKISQKRKPTIDATQAEIVEDGMA